MATTNFVRWASSPSAQLMSDDKYQTQAQTGLVPGIADLEQANKAWLQATAIGAAFAVLVTTTKASYTGVDFTDGDTNEELANKIFSVLAKRIPAEVADGSINGSKLAKGSVTSAHLAKSQDLGDHELMIRGMPLAQLQKITLKNRELAVATDTYDLYVGDGVTAGGHLVGGSKYDEITEVLAKLTNAVATLGHQAQPLSGV